MANTSNIHRSTADSNTWLVACVLVLACLGLTLPVNVGWAQTGFTQSGSLKRSPAEIVKRYVRLDQKGARLDAMAFDALSPYVEWKKEPAWDQIVVIQEAHVPEDYRKWDIIDNLDVVIPVTYRVRGSVSLKTASFVPDEKTEEVRFHVKAVGNLWRIVEPMIAPHVGVARMVNFAREAELQEKDETQRSTLAALTSSLRKAK
ncbi:MAG: hypothetical protein NW202_07640 [Nitrospira sp.]|nr:hypothetical protein [Nitrospira sp.]